MAVTCSACASGATKVSKNISNAEAHADLNHPKISDKLGVTVRTPLDRQKPSGFGAEKASKRFVSPSYIYLLVHKIIEDNKMERHMFRPVTWLQ